MIKYEVSNIVELKKQHPCKKSIEWEILRVGVDVKVKCLGCDAIILIKREVFNKKIKKIISEHLST